MSIRTFARHPVERAGRDRRPVRPPNNWDLATIRSNIFDHYDPAKVLATRVDARSIMMYPIPRAWTLDGFSSGLNARLSRRDRSFIRQAYPH
jgi:hypothetical protein